MPYLDAKGRLIGINTAIISQTGANIGIGLAIPVNMVRRALTDYIEEGKIRRGFLVSHFVLTAMEMERL